MAILRSTHRGDAWIRGEGDAGIHAEIDQLAKTQCSMLEIGIEGGGVEVLPSSIEQLNSQYELEWLVKPKLKASVPHPPSSF